MGFNYNDGSSSKEYIYQRNIQGDIIGIFDDNGTFVGGYAYDGYGNHIITQNVDGIASLNPFRYRGYFFDDETQLYYLNSRYYDPELDLGALAYNGLNIATAELRGSTYDDAYETMYNMGEAVLIQTIASGSISAYHTSISYIILITLLAQKEEIIGKVKQITCILAKKIENEWQTA